MCHECSDYSILETQLTSIEENIEGIEERLDGIDEETYSLSSAIELIIEALQKMTEKEDVIEILKKAQDKLY